MFSFRTEKYNEKKHPATGKCVLAQVEKDCVVVYQAFRPEVADYAVKNQTFGGPCYSMNRMTWIKPNFLWMMYRSGWATKEGQEHVLAIWLTKSFFEKILDEAVLSSFDSTYYNSKEAWTKALDTSDVRLQWDPDHDPFGKPLTRRALQLGIKGSIQKEFLTKGIQQITDITGFVKEQHIHVGNRKLDKLLVAEETIYDYTFKLL